MRYKNGQEIYCSEYSNATYEIGSHNAEDDPHYYTIYSGGCVQQSSGKMLWVGTGIAPLILNLSIIWRWQVNLKPRPLCSRGEGIPGTHLYRFVTQNCNRSSHVPTAPAGTPSCSGGLSLQRVQRLGSPNAATHERSVLRPLLLKS